VTPEDLLAALDDETLDPAAFHHEQHVATAWAALHEPGAEQRVCKGLRRLAERAGRAERYNEQLTLNFLRLIASRIDRARDLDWPQFRAQFPELLDQNRARAAFRELDSPTDENGRDDRARKRY
jgi:hypothetical protein